MGNAHQNFRSRREFGSYGYQISVFKIQIDCCKDCPKKLKTKLHDLNGVDSVEVDERRNRVTVKGSIASRKIIKKLDKWGRKAELVHERKETNPNEYRVESLDDDEDSSFCHGNSSGSSSRARDNYESSAYYGNEYLDHICRNKYCTYHKRDDYETNKNHDATSYPPTFPGYPVMNPFYAPPFGPPPPPLHHYAQYHGQGVMPPAAGYGYLNHGYRHGCSVM
ncbi:hypothetical protein POM88_053561 [Heracleum sosnowskyi]|uniref:HMA domain-containing protein n=1 Tax=Heracleum sosnowskyi TaxID=360622 RepID=A0AAD8GNV9_9APIA|nr:hypothetical protein POM88_053561 [Heracleum sosnowskyi]